VKIPAPALLPAEVRGAFGSDAGVRQATADTPSWAPSMVPQQRGRSNVILALVAMVAVLAGFYFYNKSASDGSLEITVLHQGQAVTEARIYVGGQLKCEFSPCKLDRVSPGNKSVRVKYGLLGGLATVEVKGGAVASVTVQVGESQAEKAPLATSSGPAVPTPTVATPSHADKATLQVSSKLAGVKVSVNGEAKGELPLKIEDLPAGKLTLRFDAGENYAPLEKDVELSAGETLKIDDVELELLRASVTFELRSPGALVKLLEGGGSTTVLDFSRGKVTKKLDTAKTWSVVATLKDHYPLKKKVKLANEPKLDVIVRLERDRSATSETPTEPRAATTGKKPPPTKPRPKKPEPKAAGGYGTINANSIPPSRVIIDGRPRGSTPVTGVRVKAGSHSVVFIHKKYGRKARTLTVASGQTKTAVVRFKKSKK
jgi:serine/threonine-protein kinase